MANRKYMYIGTLYRFGYDLTVVETTEEKAINAIKESYIKAFINQNGVHPDDEESGRYFADGRTWLEDAIADIEITKMTIGEVEWT